jgi:hypothetical protein
MPVKARAEEGFTMIMTVIGVTLIVLLAAVAVTAVNGDAQLSGHDLSRKQAYEAALAGVNEYAFHLHAEPNYWEKCTEAVPKGQPTALNQQGSTKNRRPVPGQPNAQYALELLPAAGHTFCDGSSLIAANASFVEPANGGVLGGTFRVRATGFAGGSEVKVTATFKPASFLDYVYFTQRETSDPVTYGREVMVKAATARCSLKVSEHRTESPLTNEAGEVLSAQGEPLHISRGNYVNASGEQKAPDYCDTISFVGGDNIQGPMRTNDVFVLCESPTLGRNAGDSIIVSYPEKPGWLSTSNSILHSGSNCSGSERNIKGHYLFGQGDLTPPKTNQQLKTIAEEGGYLFNGEVNICLKGAQMIVGHGKQCEGEVRPYPSNGVIYVSTVECPTFYSPFGVEYAPEANGKCGTVNVQGTFSKPLTIAAQNDILITGSLTKTNEEGMLGLIANNFIRVKHPVTVNTITRKEGSVTVTEKTCNSSSTNLEGTIQEPTIEAALLALEHSFIVDNYSCGRQLKKLNVTGAIAQYYRGAVGTTNTSGYLKNYVYDQRFERAEPPHFLEPVKSDWVIGRETTE